MIPYIANTLKQVKKYRNVAFDKVLLGILKIADNVGEKLQKCGLPVILSKIIEFVLALLLIILFAAEEKFFGVCKKGALSLAVAKSYILRFAIWYVWLTITIALYTI